jgi:hypothetical protein
MSYHYSKIIYFRSNERPNKAISNDKSDRNFYETLIIFSAKVLQGAFEKSDVPRLEEEMNRLFRSNAFNIS